MSKSYKQQNTDFFIKKLFFDSKSSKTVLFQHQIALKPSKTRSTHDYILENSIGTKLKVQKNHEIFNFSTSGYSENFMFSKRYPW